MKKLLKSQWVLVLGLLGFASGIIFWALTMQNRLNLDPDVPSRLLVLSLLLLLAIAVVRRASTLEQQYCRAVVPHCRITAMPPTCCCAATFKFLAPVTWLSTGCRLRNFRQAASLPDRRLCEPRCAGENCQGCSEPIQ